MGYARDYKELIVKETEGILEQNRNIIVVSCQRLANREFEQLRRNLRTLNSGSRLLVIKKTIANVALKKQRRKDLNDLLKDLKLRKTLALTLGDDTAKLCKALDDFRKTHEGFCLERGFVDGRCVNAEQIVSIARLPSKEVLQQQVTAAVKMPVVRLVYSLGGIYRKLVYVLVAVKEGKNGSGD